MRSFQLRVAHRPTHDAFFKECSIKSELLSYEDVLFEEATENCHAQRPEDIMDETQRQCNQLAYRFYRATRPYRINFFKFMDANSISTWSIAERIESYHCAYVCEMDATDAAEDPLELIWIDCQYHCSMKEKCGDERETIKKVIHQHAFTTDQCWKMGT